MAKQNKEYVYVDCYQCDENGKSSPWKRKHLDDVPKWQHEEAKDFNCFATVQKYANEKKTEGEDFLAPLYFDLDYSENPAVAQEEAIKLVEFFTGELDIQEQDLHIYFSGSKGFHILVDERALGVEPRKDLQRVYKHIAGYLRYRLQAGVQLILGLAQGIISNIPLILQSAVLLIQQFVTGLTQMLPTIIQGGIQLVISLIQGIISNLGTIAQAGVQIIVSLVTGLIQAIPMIIAAIPQLISAIIDTIFNTDWIAVGGEIINGIKDGFMSGFTSLVDSVKGLWSDFTGWLFGDGEEAGSAAGDGVASGVTSSSGNVASAASQTTQTATQNFQFDYGVLEGYGQQATNSVANGLNTGSGTLNYSATAVGTNTSNSILSGMQTVDLASGGTQATNSILAGLNTGGVQLTTTATTLGTETATNLNNSLLTGGAGLQATASQLGTDTINSLSTSRIPRRQSTRHFAPTRRTSPIITRSATT